MSDEITRVGSKNGVTRQRNREINDSYHKTSLILRTKAVFGELEFLLSQTDVGQREEQLGQYSCYVNQLYDECADVKMYDQCIELFPYILWYAKRQED